MRWVKPSIATVDPSWMSSLTAASSEVISATVAPLTPNRMAAIHPPKVADTPSTHRMTDRQQAIPTRRVAV